MFHHAITIELQHTDCFGLLFFPHQTAFCHNAFQAWQAARGRPMVSSRELAREVAVVVHLESDYRAPLRLGDRVDAAFSVVEVGATSFTYHLAFTRHDGGEVGTCRVVMVTTDPRNGAKMAIPDDLRALLLAER
jgi:acyl-CoA thioesterase FadM